MILKRIMSQKCQIGISVFNTDTYPQFMEHSGTLGHDKKIHCMKVGDIVLLYNLNTKEVFGIAILRAFSNGKIYNQLHPYDQELYAGKYRQYSKYEINAKIYLIEPVSIQTINIECGLDENKQIVNGHIVSYKRTDKLIAPWVNRVLAEILIAQNM